jgi:hypothetical protein
MEGMRSATRKKIRTIFVFKELSELAFWLYEKYTGGHQLILLIFLL